MGAVGDFGESWREAPSPPIRADSGGAAAVVPVQIECSAAQRGGTLNTRRPEAGTAAGHPPVAGRLHVFPCQKNAT